MSSLGRGIHTATAQAARVHLPPARHGTKSPFIYFSQFPSLGLSGEMTRTSALYKGFVALATISSTFPPSPSPPDAVQHLQDPSALGDPPRALCSLQAVLAADLSESTCKKTALLKG